LTALANPETAASLRAGNFVSSWPRVLRLLVLTVLFSAAAVYEAGNLKSLTTPEVWVHIRSGTWIWQNHAVPRTGLFSQYPSLAWNDSTWAFDALLGAAYRLLGLAAIPVVFMAMKAALAGLMFFLARALRARFWAAVFLSAVAQYVIWSLQPLPYVCSIFFLTIEIELLMSSRRTGSPRRLFWLPLIFAVWANFHVQFLLGLVLLGLFLISLCAESWLRGMGVSWLSSRIGPIPLIPASAAVALSTLATLATPYTFRLLPQAFHALYSDVAFEHFTELGSMSFRRPQEFALMLLLMMAFLALGRLRALELFELLMLSAGTAIAFRIQRDSWMVVLPAVAVLASGFLSRPNDDDSDRASAFKWGGAYVAGITVLVLVIAALRLPSRDVLMGRVNQNFPVKACDAIVANKLPAPLFNAYSWGSFVTWYLPQYPVIVDSRTEMYGDDNLAKYFDVVGGKGRLEDAPMVATAGTLLLERNSAIAKALTNLPRLRSQYRLVYSDEIASVFIPEKQKQ